jgi:hypothetical protein
MKVNHKPTLGSLARSALRHLMARPIASAIDPCREARTLHQTPSRVKAFLFTSNALTSIVDWKKASRELLLARSLSLTVAL